MSYYFAIKLGIVHGGTTCQDADFSTFDKATFGYRVEERDGGAEAELLYDTVSPLSLEPANKLHTDDIKKGGLKPIMAIPVQEASIEHLIPASQGEAAMASMYLFQFRGNAWLRQAEEQLHPRELDIYRTYLHEQRRRTYLAGRYAAKRAIALYRQETDLSRIWVDRGVFGQPVVAYERNIQVSITHCDEIAAAIAFPESFPLGIDMERIRRDSVAALEEQVTLRERHMLKALPHSEEISLTLIWTVKEALSKVLRTGLTIPFNILELKEIEDRNGVYVSSFKYFYQYETVSILFLPFVCSITYPKGTPVDFDALQKKLIPHKRIE